MKIECNYIDENRKLRSCKSEEALQKIREKAASCIWIDIENPKLEELQANLEPLGLHRLVIENCMEPESSAPLATYKQCILVRFPYNLDLNTAEQNVLSIICLKSAIITVHLDVAPEMQRIIHDFSTAMRFQTQGPSSVLFQILDRMIDEDLDEVLKSRRKLEQLAELIESEHSHDLTDRLRELKHTTARLTALCEEQRFTLSRIQSANIGFFDIERLNFHFNDILAHLEYALTSVTRQRNHLSELQQQHSLSLSERSNRRLKILTILSSIFMPLTLITGIYGMNFHYMPELEWHYAYPVALIIMLLISLGLLWNFHRKGWFD